MGTKTTELESQRAVIPPDFSRPQEAPCERQLPGRHPRLFATLGPLDSGQASGATGVTPLTSPSALPIGELRIKSGGAITSTRATASSFSCWETKFVHLATLYSLQGNSGVTEARSRLLQSTGNLSSEASPWVWVMDAPGVCLHFSTVSPSTQDSQHLLLQRGRAAGRGDEYSSLAHPLRLIPSPWPS